MNGHTSDWLIDWLIDRVINRVIDWLIDCLIALPTYTFWFSILSLRSQSNVSARNKTMLGDESSVFNDTTLPGADSLVEENSPKKDQQVAATSKDNKVCEKIRDLKADLVHWRVLLVMSLDILTWKKKWHPVALFTGNSLLFLTIWWLSISLLSGLALLGIAVTMADFLVPFLTLNHDEW